MPAKKIAITVEATLLARAERVRRRTAESRSAMFARVLRTLLTEEEHARRVAEYVEAYRRLPETPPEIRWVDELSAASLAEVAWEDE